MGSSKPRVTGKLREDPRVKLTKVTPIFEIGSIGRFRVEFEIDPVMPPRELGQLLASWAAVILAPNEIVPKLREDAMIAWAVLEPVQHGKPPLTQGEAAIRTGHDIRRIKLARERSPEAFRGIRELIEKHRPS